MTPEELQKVYQFHALKRASSELGQAHWHKALTDKEYRTILKIIEPKISEYSLWCSDHIIPLSQKPLPFSDESEKSPSQGPSNSSDQPLPKESSKESLDEQNHQTV